MQSPSSIPLAIIGMACRLPGADNVDQFWKLVVEGRNAIVELPPDRLDQELYYDNRVGQIGKTYSKLGAIINSRQFNPAVCPVPQSLIDSVDGAHLLMCQTAVEALRHAGLDPFNVPLRNTGVYIGHAQGSTLGGDLTYASYAEEAAELLRQVDEFRALPAAQQDRVIARLIERIRGPLPKRTAQSADVACSLVAGAITQALGLTGPYLALNSACASSLQSMLVAARALQLGRVDMAIAGGASDCKSDSLVLFAHARALSSQGSRPFDAEADGLIVGEGYAAVVMKTLARALSDGDRVLAVVRGLGVSSDGKGKSLWAPRKEGQVLAMQRAYRDGLHLGDLDYLEAHATATQLGDATELNTLAEALTGKLPPGKKVPITSVKANIGHTLETAGIAGVIKTILAMQHNTIPPAASVTRLNPKIDWEKSPVYVPLAPQPWPPHADGRPRRAGVNAFGIGGLNMHVALEEFNDSSRRLAPPASGAPRDHDAVAVIGMGCVWPGARGTDAFWNLLTSDRDPKGPVPPDRWRSDLVRRPGPGRELCLENLRGGFITDFVYDWQKHKIPPKQVAQADPLQFMLLDAADQAIKQAGYDSRPFDRTGVGVVVGTEFGGDFAFQLQLGLRLPELRQHIEQLLSADELAADQVAAIQQKFTKTLLNLWPALIDETGSFSTSSLASRTAKTWNLMGGAVAIDAGHGSALAALALAVDALLAGDCEMMICAAGQRRLGLPEYEALAMTGMLAPDAQRACPLDAQARGYVPGEGVGVLLLKRLSAARRDGDTVQFVIRGVGAAHHAAAPEAMGLAVQRSLAGTDACADDVQVLELDGAVAVDGQIETLRAVASAYASSRNEPLALSSVAGQIGHAEAAAGMASLQKAGLEMARHTIPKPMGLIEPAALGEWGTAAAAVTADAPLKPVGDRPLLAAVATRSRGVTYQAVIEAGETAMRNTMSPTAPAIAAPLKTAAAPVVQAQPAAMGISGGAERPRIVFCCSGQGSQYAGMAEALVKESPAAAEALRQADELLTRYGYPRFAEFAWGAAAELGKNPWLTQLSMLVTDNLYMAALAERGVRPDEVLGHSYGEYPALVAAGAMDLETAMVLTRARCDGVAAAKVVGGMLAVSADRTDIERLIGDSGLPIAVANHNSPQQTVVGGTHEALEQFQALLKPRRLSSQIIAVPAPFHTPLMKPAAGYFERQIVAAAIGDPRLPHWSVTNNRLTATGDDVRRNLVSLLSAPVLYVDLIETVTAGRPCVLVEVGPGEVLTKLHRKIVSRSDVTCIACDAPKGAAAAGIVKVRETLEQLGCYRAEMPAAPAAATLPGKKHELLAFDATARRRERMRQAAQNKQGARPGEPRPSPARPAPPAPPALPIAKAVAPPPAPVVEATPAAAPQLEKFLINFVVEQTGYPPEVVELDADLEADLGIDSIKKAQLFGELQEYFDVTPSADLTLDMFPTLRHVLDFLRTVPTKGDLAAPAATPAEVLEPSASSAMATALPSAASGAGVEELERFLINFVVEQTGYPSEVVELDADLEADLGIDSIKKAQLFGELQEYFDVTPSADLTLDMFPTLRHVLDFLRTVPTKGNLTATDASPLAPALALASSVTAAADEREAVAAGVEELEQFLINFVVEQTGYPPEVVELDADLEADLGIDSIKKAQLFGELQEYFDVTPTADLTLDMFPTLRHVLDFLRSVPRKGAAAEPAAIAPAAPRVKEIEEAPQPTASPAAQPAPWTPSTSTEPLAVAGTPYEMGQQHGEKLRAEIRQTLRMYADLSPNARDEMPGLANVSDLRAHFGDEELDELQGIADGADVLLESVLWHNLAVTVDFGAAHWQSAAARRTGEGMVHAGAWSLPLLAPLREAVRPVVMVRRPRLGAAHAVVALAGCVGAVAGVNAQGLSVSGAAPSAGESSSRRAVPRGWLPAVTGLLAQASTPDEAAHCLHTDNVDGTFVLGQCSTTETLAVDGAGHSLASESASQAVVAAGLSDGLLAQTVERLRGLAQRPAVYNGATISAAFDEAPVGILTEEAPVAVTAVIEVGGSEVWLAAGDEPGGEGPVAVGTLLGIGRAPTTSKQRDAKPANGKHTSNGNGRSHLGPGEHNNAAAAPAIAKAAPAPVGQLEPTVRPPAPALVADPLASRRFVMRTVPAPFDADAPREPAWQGPAVLLGDHPAAAALRARLESAGVPVHAFDSRLTTEEAVAGLDRIIRAGPAPHLFLFSDHDPTPADLWDEASFTAQFERQVRRPFWVAQKWLAAAVEQKWLDRATVVAVTSLGGELGFKGAVPAPLGGALTGLVKAICIEFHVVRDMKNLRFKAIDAPPSEDPRSLADNIVRELAWRKLDYEVVFRQGQRYLQNSVVAPLSDARLRQPIPAGAWVVTGGARGITAECALALAQTFPVKLHLLGTTSLAQMAPQWRDLSDDGRKALKSQIMIAAQRSGRRPSDAWDEVSKAIEIDQSLERFRQAGVKFSYHTCDVADAAAVRQTLEKIRRQDGPICGVLHGAGVERACRFEKKSIAPVEATWGSKVRGAYNLMRLTRRDPLRHFVGFGSVSGRLGGNGQVDYCAASDALAKLAGWLQSERPDCHAVTFHWHPWDDVGMAARPETRGAFQMLDAPALMPKRQGLAHFLAELAYGDGRSETLVTSAEYFERFYGKGAADRREESPSVTSEMFAKAAPTTGERSASSSVAASQRRRVLTLVAAPLPEPAPAPRLAGTALVLGRGPAADAAAAAFQQAGAGVQRLAPAEDEATLLRDLDALWDRAPADHLALVADDAAIDITNADACRRRRWCDVLLPLLVTQRWLKRLRQSKPTGAAHLVALTRLGDDRPGLSAAAAAGGGALAGLIKSVFIEGARHAIVDVRPKVIDLPFAGSPDEIARTVLSELAAPPVPVEIRWRDGKRYSLVAAPQPPQADTAWQPERGGVWVVTGGARGITAETALELGRRYGLKLHLLGASPPPPADAPWLRAIDDELRDHKRQVVQAEVAAGRSPEDAWLKVKKAREIAATLDRFRVAGVSATYHACDVADWAALDHTLEAIRRQDGPIAGIVHGAGFARPGRLETKSRSLMERAIEPKFDGALALAALTQRDPLRHFVMFGSISGRFGGNGLAEYSAANEAMSALAAHWRHARPACRTTCIAWQTWEGIGMATMSDGVAINRNNLDSHYISAQQGVDHFMAEIDAGLPDAEVVISDGTFEKNFYGPAALAERTFPWRVSGSAATELAPQAKLPPLIDVFESLGDGGGRATIVFHPTTDPFLIDHKLRDAPFLPGVVALAALAQAAHLTAASRCVVGLRNVEIVQGIKFPGPQPITAHVELRPGDGVVAANLTVEVRTRQGKLVDAARPCCTGDVVLADSALRLDAPPPGKPPQPWVPFAYPDAALLWHGPRLRALKQCWFEAEGGWVQIAAPDPADLAGPRSADGWQILPAVLDACVVACGSCIFLMHGGRLEVPHQFEQLRIAAWPRTGEMCTLRFHLRSHADQHSRFDFTLFGADGRALIDVAGYRTVLVAPPAPLGA